MPCWRAVWPTRVRRYVDGSEIGSVSGYRDMVERDPTFETPEIRYEGGTPEESDALSAGARRRPLVPEAIVEATEKPAVRLVGGATVAVGDDVVDLAGR